MNGSESAADDETSQNQVPISVVKQLLSAVVQIGDSHAELVERRRALLFKVADLLQADAGFWAWGRGWPDSSSVAPVAFLDLGFTDQQRAAMMQWALDPETERVFRKRIRMQMGNARRATTRKEEIFDRTEWDAALMRRQLASGGWENWLHSVRYSDHDTWSNLFFLRNCGRPDFGPDEAVIVDLVLASVPWLQSTAEEFLPPEAFVGLTPRQRTVMLLLLDGFARKSIARHLAITEDTVGDHIKSIYTQFGVSSASELAARFLRSR